MVISLPGYCYGGKQAGMTAKQDKYYSFDKQVVALDSATVQIEMLGLIVSKPVFCQIISYWTIGQI